jgi:hypothetical protein
MRGVAWKVSPIELFGAVAQGMHGKTLHRRKIARGATECAIEHLDASWRAEGFQEEEK